MSASVTLATLVTSLLTLALAQQAQELSYSLVEETPVGYRVADVISDARIRSIFDDDDAILDQLEYSFLALDPDFRDNFVIDATTGVITVAQTIDRDVTCAAVTSCIIKMDVGIRPVAYFHQIKISVTLTDLNDNAPAFDESAVVVAIPENGVEGE